VTKGGQGKAQGQDTGEVARLRSQLEESQQTIRALINNAIDTVAEAPSSGPVLLRTAQAALRRSEQQLRAVFASALDAMLLADDTGGYIDANPSACELFGATREVIIGKCIADFSEHREGFAENWTSFLDAGHAAGEFVVVRADGDKRIVEFRATANILPGTHLSVLRDVTARHAAEAAVAASQRRLRGLLEHGADLVMVQDVQGTIQYASPSVLRVLGYRQADVERDDFLALVHAEDRESVRASLAAIRSQPGRMATLRYRARHRDGSWRMHETIATNLLNDPALAGVVTNARDVTDREQLQEQVLQAQKMEAVGRLAGGVAHDFNNLLSVILSLTDLLQRELEPSTAAAQDLHEISAAARRGATLTRQLLAFSRKQMLQPRVINVNAIVAELARMIERVVGENIVFQTELAPEVSPVRVDPSQLEHALLNLVINARDAMPGGGRVTVRTCNFMVPPASADHPHVAPGPYVRISVEDDGSGMDEAVRSRVFEPFFTTKPPGKGSGLGLATVFGTVTQSGGHVSVRSAPGRGSTFDLLLPATSERGQCVAPPSAGEDRAPCHQTLLVVEDDELVRRVMVRILRGAGYVVLSASSGPEAIAIARQTPDPIALVITDVIMPDMAGPQVAAALESLLPGVAVLYVTGYADQMLVERGMLRQGWHLLEKPISRDALLRKIAEVLPA
jgi:PAS domain S-box-containing protein